MRDFLNAEGPLGRFLSRAADMVGVSLLWLLCSLPVVTMGAATAGLYTAVMKEDEGVWKPFFAGFRSCFWKATAAELVFVLLAAALALDLRILYGTAAAWAGIFRALTWLVLLLVLASACYTFPLLARFEQTFAQTLRNGLFLSLRCLPDTLLLLAVHLLPLLAAALNPELFTAVGLPVLIFLGPGLTASLCTWRLKTVFARFGSEA